MLMTTVFFIILFVIQTISFYFLALLYTKVSNFDDLEKKQRKLMAEMDDSIAAYLTELKDENDRLIDQLDGKAEKAKVSYEEKARDVFLENQPSEKKNNPVFDMTTPIIPLNIALKSYGAPKQLEPELEEVQESDERMRAIKLYDAGESIENIAKTLGKGRIEVELILKFR